MSPTGRKLGKVRVGDRAPGVRGKRGGQVFRGRLWMKCGVKCRRGASRGWGGKGLRANRAPCHCSPLCAMCQHPLSSLGTKPGAPSPPPSTLSSCSSGQGPCTMVSQEWHCASILFPHSLGHEAAVWPFCSFSKGFYCLEWGKWKGYMAPSRSSPLLPSFSILFLLHLDPVGRGKGLRSHHGECGTHKGPIHIAEKTSLKHSCSRTGAWGAVWVERRWGEGWWCLPWGWGSRREEKLLGVSPLDFSSHLLLASKVLLPKPL